MYRDAHILARLVREGGLEEQFGTQAVYNLQCDVEPVIRGAYEKTENQTPEVREWESWNGVIRPGWFFASDLYTVRGELVIRLSSHTQATPSPATVS